jgi:hypothetical protein
MDEFRNAAQLDIGRGRVDELARCVHRKTQRNFKELGSVPSQTMATSIMDDVRGTQAR